MLYFYLWKSDKGMFQIWIFGIQREKFGYFIYILHHVIVKLLLDSTMYLGCTVALQNPTD